MPTDNISRISQHIPLQGIPSVRRPAKKSKNQDSDEHRSPRENLEDTVEIINNENDTKISVEPLDENLLDDSRQPTDKAPGALINIVVK